jgi:hypothetical protein
MFPGILFSSFLTLSELRHRMIHEYFWHFRFILSSSSSKPRISRCHWEFFPSFFYLTRINPSLTQSSFPASVLPRGTRPRHASYVTAKTHLSMSTWLIIWVQFPLDKATTCGLNMTHLMSPIPHVVIAVHIEIDSLGVHHGRLTFFYSSPFNVTLTAGVHSRTELRQESRRVSVALKVMVGL